MIAGPAQSTVTDGCRRLHRPKANDARNHIPPARSSDFGVRARRTWWNGHDFRRRTISDDQARHSQKEPPRDDLPRPSASGLAEVNGIELAWQTLLKA
jgi:hypothetical protein